MLAQVLIAEANSFVALWKDWKLPDGRDRVVRSWPWAGSRNPDRGRACRGPSRQGTRPGRRGRSGEDPLHLVDPVEAGAAGCRFSTFVGVDRRLPGGARRPPGSTAREKEPFLEAPRLHLHRAVPTEGGRSSSMPIRPSFPLASRCRLDSSSTNWSPTLFNILGLRTKAEACTSNLRPT